MECPFLLVVKEVTTLLSDVYAFRDVESHVYLQDVLYL